MTAPQGGQRAGWEGRAERKVGEKDARPRQVKAALRRQRGKSFCQKMVI